MAPLLADHHKMGCAGILAMPNTKPPVAKVKKTDDGDCWSIEEYRDMLMRAGADKFSTVLTPLYLTADTTPQMIEAGAKSGLLTCAKYYPPHGTTGAEFGAPLQAYADKGVLRAMADNNVILNIHGEEHGLKGEDYFGRHTNAEEFFYRERLPRVLDAFPALKIVGEHVTTRVAVETIKAAGPNVAATITPQHLLYTVGHMLQGFKYHLYCLPLLKYEDDRAALRAAVISDKNTKFFAGTDSAPHVQKVTPCGCAAGCYTGGIAPQLYAQAFERAGAEVSDSAFRNFLCLNGPAFYGLPVPAETFKMQNKSVEICIENFPAGSVVPLPAGLENTGKAELYWSLV